MEISTQVNEVLGELEGDHEVLSVLAAYLKADDVVILGHCVRRLRREANWMLGYVYWDVSTMAGREVGRWEFRDDGVVRHIVLRRKAS